ncbi:MAG: endonuclease MutS2 [Chloroflexota bacterium]
MQPKHLLTLELDKVLARLSALASFSASRELILNLQPETSLARVRALQAATTEARGLLANRPGLTIGAARDVRPLANRARLGAVPRPEEFLDILSTIESSRAMHALLRRGEIECPHLVLLAGRLHPFDNLRSQIAAAINDRAEVVDSASPALARLRALVRGGRERVLRRLEAIMVDPNNAEAIQEPIITERAGRYVLAVKAGERHRVRGVVHDQSESGATLFIEPLAVVELTNEWRQQQLDEQREVERILRLLSEQVGQEAARLIETVEALAELDAALARGRLGEEMDALEPELNDRGQIELIEARHPLLTGRVVPQTIRLGEDYRVLVITGPNTGGKTVALKTVGLLTLMAQCGMHLPVASGSRAAVFEDVLADIGDEQSIEQSLSTFSAHMRTIVFILSIAGRVAPAQSLVLMDELGAGTDPTEGAALARGILDYLLQRQIPTIATTHYSELKTFAHERDGVENASVEFDLNSLAPTYRLSIGTPGRSNALAIAERLGVPDEIIQRARNELPDEHLRVEGLLEDIRKKERLAAHQRNRASRDQQQARRQRVEAAEALNEAERLRAEARERAHAEAEEELANLRRDIARMPRQVERRRPDERAAQSLQEEVGRAGERLARTRPRRPASDDAERLVEVQMGQSVRLPGLSQAGEVVALPDDRGEVEVQVGGFTVRVAAAELRRASRPRPSGPGTTFRPAPDEPGAGHSLSRPLDLRGMRAAEIEPLLDRELNDAFVANVPFMKIIHGHGSGTVRAIVRQFLASQPYVSAYEPATPGDGGDGATIVHLAL